MTEQMRRYRRLDRTGYWCGTIVLDRDVGDSTSGKEPVEFIAISEAKNLDVDEHAG